MNDWIVSAGIFYFLFLNVVGLVSMADDKRRAKRNLWRIPERTLFLIALLGGSIGSLAGMYLFRHKTKHPRFVIGMPVILLLQVSLICVIVYRKGVL
ncbi:MAG: DUF1294 domain-containing protein [Lachnospiraceae bacterium]|nr:DUF1294 domain-containing protein [Lachnospiraceae bacterium]